MLTFGDRNSSGRSGCKGCKVRMLRFGDRNNPG